MDDSPKDPKIAGLPPLRESSMRAISRILVLLIISVLFGACGGGGSRQPQQAPSIEPPVAPVVTVSADTKQLIFSWETVAAATYYRLLENPDGHSGFNQIGEIIPGSAASVSMEIAAHLHDWVSALYLVQACNSGGCTDSTQVSTTDLMLGTIGYFKASDSEVGDGFGFRVRLSADGKTLAVVALGKTYRPTGSYGNDDHWGAVNVFQNDGSNWYEQVSLKPPYPDEDGWTGIYAFDMSADGSTLAIGDPTQSYADVTDEYAYGIGAVHVIRVTDSGWAPEAWLGPWWMYSGQSFGESVALSADGKTIAVGAPGDEHCPTGIHPEPPTEQCWWDDAGAVTVYRFGDNKWKVEAFITSNTWGWFFGEEVALSDDGNLLAIYAPFEETIFENDNPLGWEKGWLGRVYLYRFDGSEWIEIARVAPADETQDIRFVALSSDGSTLVTNLCAYEETDDRWGCETELRRFDGSSWTVRATTPIRDVCDLSADGNVLVICNDADDSDAIGINGDRNNDMAEASGAADILEFNGVEWSQGSYIKAPNTGAGDRFGYSAALSADGNTLVVGAFREDGGSKGINGNQVEDAGISADSPPLVQRDLNRRGDGLLTLDTSTGLEWLDITETDLNLSYNRMVGELDKGGMFEGFRYATEDEVLTLLTNAGIDVSSIGEANFEPITAFQALIGINYIALGQLNDSGGLTSTDPDPGHCSSPCKVMVTARRFVSGEYAGQGTVPISTRGLDVTGDNLAHWLVRDATTTGTVKDSGAVYIY